MLLFAQNIQAQPTAGNTCFKVGALNAANTYITIHLFNQSSLPILSAEASGTGNYHLQITAGSIPPGESGMLRIRLIPKKQGKFKETISLRINDEKEPILLSIKGRHEKEKRKNQACPDFSSRKVRYKNQTTPRLPRTEFYLSLKDSHPDLKPNNLIILLDASSSMKEAKKKELLNLAFSGLTEILRPIDQVTVISYASEPKVLLPPGKAVSPQTLITMIEKMESQGYTNGSSAIKRAFQIADSTYDEKANNEIILATDGAFNLNETENIIEKVIAPYSSGGIRLSVLGIENQPWAAKEMKRITRAGNGQYIYVNSPKKARNSLKKTIKNHARN